MLVASSDQFVLALANFKASSGMFVVVIFGKVNCELLYNSMHFTNPKQGILFNVPKVVDLFFECFHTNNS